MDTLFHYCSTESFHSIIKNRTIWLSSMSLSNDTKEGRLISEIIKKIADDDGLNSKGKDKLLKSVSAFENYFDGLGFCLSLNGDLLSQWRGYAQDATGISIGFSKEYLEQFAEASYDDNKASFSLHQIEYDPKKQQQLVSPAYQKIKELIDDGVYKSTSAIEKSMIPNGKTEGEMRTGPFDKVSLNLFKLFMHLFTLKSSAFSEEQEWRLISPSVKEGMDDALFRPGFDRLIPYRKFKFIDLDQKIINKVTIGPKNITPISIIKKFLESSRFKDVEVVSSRVSYRG